MPQDADRPPHWTHHPYHACLAPEDYVPHEDMFGSVCDRQLVDFRVKMCKHMYNGRCTAKACTFAHSIWTMRCPEQNAVDQKRGGCYGGFLGPVDLYDRYCAAGTYIRPAYLWTPEMTDLALAARQCAAQSHTDFHNAFVKMLKRQLTKPKPTRIGKVDVTPWMTRQLQELAGAIERESERTGVWA